MAVARAAGPQDRTNGAIEPREAEVTLETSTPVTGHQFFDRADEMAQLSSVVSDARQGVRRWVALVGHRKIGKTSVLLELLRRHGSEAPMPYIDCWEARADPLSFICRLVRALIAAAVRQLGAESDVAPLEPAPGARFASRVVQALARMGCSSIDEAVRLHDEVASGSVSRGALQRAFDLPQGLASDLGEHLIVILDEFQELRRLDHLRRLGGGAHDILAILRSAWQHQKGVSYIVAGSHLTLMRQILTEENSPFFQHFEMIKLEPFGRQDSLGMLQEILNTDRPIPRSTTVNRILDIVGDHPFYVRALVREIASVPRVEKMALARLEQALRESLEATLFDQNGRLSLFMEQRYRVVTGESSLLESVLRGFVEPARITDVANMLHVRTGAVSTAVKTLLMEDVLVKCADGRYAFADPAFAVWLKHQVDFRQAMPPLLVGTESEQIVARRLAADGFRGVYLSRASRGAFDLLAVHDTRVFGLQIKTAKLPYTLRSHEKTRLVSDARRLGFHPILALVVSGQVRFYDLRERGTRGALTIREKTPREETLLAFL